MWECGADRGCGSHFSDGSARGGFDRLGGTLAKYGGRIKKPAAQGGITWKDMIEADSVLSFQYFFHIGWQLEDNDADSAGIESKDHARLVFD